MLMYAYEVMVLKTLTIWLQMFLNKDNEFEETVIHGDE